jgi:hypothetical protein
MNVAPSSTIADDTRRRPRKVRVGAAFRNQERRAVTGASGAERAPEARVVTEVAMGSLPHGKGGTRKAQV